MRTTLTLDDDVLAVAKSLARARSESVGKAVSDLVRRGIEAVPRVTQCGSDDAFPVFKINRGAAPITLEQVKLDEDDA
jgi:hypothetical protein